jgi:YD repeat-containing protein
LTAQTTDTAAAPGRLEQNLRYGYDAAGGLVRIDDLANNRATTYALDLSGRHLREKVATRTTDPTVAEVFQDNHLAYDTLGRLTLSSDNRVLLTLQYDAAGDRTRIANRVLVDAVGDDDVESLKYTVRYFEYDRMNGPARLDGAAAQRPSVSVGYR